MNLYEGMFVMDHRQANRDWEGSLESLKGILTKQGAEILRCERWGDRRLAYEIQGQRRATYVLIYFRASGEAISGIYRDVELSELLLRALVLKVPALPPEKPTEPRPAAEKAPESKEPPAEPAKVPDRPQTAAEAKVETETDTSEEAPSDAEPEQAEGPAPTPESENPKDTV